MAKGFSGITEFSEDIKCPKQASDIEFSKKDLEFVVLCNQYIEKCVDVLNDFFNIEQTASLARIVPQRTGLNDIFNIEQTVSKTGRVWGKLENFMISVTRKYIKTYNGGEINQSLPREKSLHILEELFLCLALVKEFISHRENLNDMVVLSLHLMVMIFGIPTRCALEKVTGIKSSIECFGEVGYDIETRVKTKKGNYLMVGDKTKTGNSPKEQEILAYWSNIPEQLLLIQEASKKITSALLVGITEDVRKKACDNIIKLLMIHYYRLVKIHGISIDVKQDALDDFLFRKFPAYVRFFSDSWFGTSFDQNENNITNIEKKVTRQDSHSRKNTQKKIFPTNHSNYIWGIFFLIIFVGAAVALKLSLYSAYLKNNPDGFYRADAQKKISELQKRESLDEDNLLNLSVSNNQVFTIGNGVALDMVYVDKGRFTMGSCDSGAYSNEMPHTVTLTKDYWIGKYEVTQEQYEAVMGMNPSFFKKGGKYPVEEVSWNDVREFCKKLNRMFSSHLPAGYEFRLPTEAEWEYAARGGPKSKCYKYSGSNDIKEVAWYTGKTHPVGGKLPNELGIYDMSGNVYEWCQDYYDSSATYKNDIVDPLCTTGLHRVVRGGGWSSFARHCCVSNRDCFAPSNRNNNLGFRLTLAPKVTITSNQVIPSVTSDSLSYEVRSNSRSFAIGNGISLDMVYVEKGSFTMGSSDIDASKNETPHTVTLTKDYWIGKYEVTQEQYEAIMGTNPSDFKKDAKYPVECVSRNDAQSFCKKLNSMLSLQLPSGYEFRLPTEAEWEYAALGGKKSKGFKYSGSNDIDIVAWYHDNSDKTTHLVGSKLPNELGIYDMNGNVWEWCLDCYAKTATYQDGIQDPLCTTGSYRVVRGGSWVNDAGSCRVSRRICCDPSGSYGSLGFRLALALCSNQESC